MNHLGKEFKSDGQQIIFYQPVNESIIAEIESGSEELIQDAGGRLGDLNWHRLHEQTETEIQDNSDRQAEDKMLLCHFRSLPIKSVNDSKMEAMLFGLQRAIATIATIESTTTKAIMNSNDDIFNSPNRMCLRMTTP